MGQWSWKIKEYVQTLETAGGVSGGGKICLLWAITKANNMEPKKVQAGKGSEKLRPREEGVTSPKSLLEAEGRAGIST